MVLLLTVTFAMIHLVPGDPVRASLGTTAPPQLVKAKRAQLGLDKPLWQQYGDYVGRVLHGDFGTSLTSGEPVTDIVREKLPFPSLVVWSEDDPYGAPDEARAMATDWGSRERSAGARGHLNGDSGLGDWAEGRRWLAELLGR